MQTTLCVFLLIRGSMDTLLPRIFKIYRYFHFCSKLSPVELVAGEDAVQLLLPTVDEVAGR